MDQDFKFYYKLLKNGAYHAVTPMGVDDINIINELQEEFKDYIDEFHTDEDYHSTLMYSTYGKYIQPSTNLVHDARITGIADFGGYLVLLLDSESMCTRHEELSYMGLKHSFDEYNPHITIGSLKPDTKLPNVSLDKEIKLGNEYNEPLDN